MFEGLKVTGACLLVGWGVNGLITFVQWSVKSHQRSSAVYSYMHILSIDAHTYSTQSCRYALTHTFTPSGVYAYVKAHMYTHTHILWSRNNTSPEDLPYACSYLHTHTHAHKPHLNSTPAALMTLNIINHNKTFNSSTIYLWLKLLFIAVMMNLLSEQAGYSLTSSNDIVVGEEYEDWDLQHILMKYWLTSIHTKTRLCVGIMWEYELVLGQQMLWKNLLNVKKEMVELWKIIRLHEAAATGPPSTVAWNSTSYMYYDVMIEYINLCFCFNCIQERR